VAKPSPLVENLEGTVNEAVASFPEPTNYAEVAVAFFDLVGSTQRKIKEGHSSGTTAALQHNAIVGSIAAKFNGNVIKSLGDGLLVLRVRGTQRSPRSTPWPRSPTIQTSRRKSG